MAVEIGPDCNRCALGVGGWCVEQRFNHDGEPIQKGLTGDRKTCSGFVPDWICRLNDLGSRAREVIRNVGAAIPPI